jgi:predicted transcriptional regulator
VAVGDWGVPTTVKNTTTALLNEVRESKGLRSDYALAKLLSVRTQTITSYRTGRTQMSDEMALRTARILGRAAAPIFAQLASERAKDPEVAKVWVDAAKVLARSSRK